MSGPDDLCDPVVMGRIVGAYGVKGWIKVQPYTGEVGALARYPEWWIGHEGAWRSIGIEAAEAHGASLVARPAGITDRDAAARLGGLDVAVARAALPAPAENEVYWADLVGLTVANTAGESLGTIEEVFSNGAHDVLRVQDGDIERLMPYVAAVVRSVDLVARRVTVEWGREW